MTHAIVSRKHVYPILWALLILVSCMLPPSDLPKQGWMNIPYFDKMVHIGFYFILFWLLNLACPNATSTGLSTGLVVNVLICIVYGILIEILQHFFTSYRSAEALDVLADGIGATFAAVIALTVKRRRFV